MEPEVRARGGICGPKCKARYVMAIMASVGMGIIYGLKVALHVVIVAMVNHTAVSPATSLNESKKHSSEACNFGNTTSVAGKSEDGPFDWNSSMQGLVLSAYFWGYLISQIPGGRMAELFSAKWVMFVAVGMNVVCTLLSPIMSKLHIVALIIMRVFMGIGGGFSFPANHVLLAHWAPPNERSVMSSIIYAGTSLGTVIFMLLSGVLAGALGWEAVFYIEGSFSIIWMVLWVILVNDSPKTQRLISVEERAFILEGLQAERHGQQEVKHPKMPWKSAFLSLPFWAILIAHTCSNWGWYMVLVELPTYMKHVLEFDISQNGFFSSFPFFTMWVFSIIYSKILDILRAKGKITTTTARKLSTLIASVLPMCCFIALNFVECNRPLAIVLMTLAVTCVGGMFSGFLSNHIDIAPNFAGTLIAITNTAATIPGILVPLVVGVLTNEDPGIDSWRIIFGITIILYIIEIIIYTIFASGEIQKWNNVSDSGEPRETQPLQPK